MVAVDIGDAGHIGRVGCRVEKRKEVAEFRWDF